MKGAQVQKEGVMYLGKDTSSSIIEASWQAIVQGFSVVLRKEVSLDGGLEFTPFGEPL